MEKETGQTLLEETQIYFFLRLLSVIKSWKKVHFVTKNMGSMLMQHCYFHIDLFCKILHVPLDNRCTTRALQILSKDLAFSPAV